MEKDPVNNPVNDPVENAPVQELASGDKWKYTLYTTVIFLIVANPYMYKFVQIILGKFVKIADKGGCPTWVGFLLHAVVFTLILRAIM
jgi:hypothetical protein